MRNIIVHEYFGINYEIVWNTITNDLEYLEYKINDILKDNNYFDFQEQTK